MGNLSRRGVLAATASAAVAALAGCSTTVTTGDTLVEAADWPMPYHDTASTAAAAADLGASPEVAWRRDVLDGGFVYDFSYFPQSVSDGERAYVGGAGLHVLDSADGAASQHFADEAVFGPALRDDSVFVASAPDTGTLAVRRLDRETLSVQWTETFSRDTPRSRSVLVSDDTVYVAVGTGSARAAPPASSELLALSANDGTLDYSLALSDASYTPMPAVADGTVYAEGASGNLVAVGPNCDAFCRYLGDPPERAWTAARPDGRPLRVQLRDPPVVGDDRVFLGDQRLVQDSPGVLSALDRETGERLWAREYRDWVSSPALDADALYAATFDAAGVDAVSVTRDGTERWRTPLDGYGTLTPPVLAGSTLVVGVQGDTAPSRVYGLDAASGRQRWRVDVPTTPGALSLAGDTVVVTGWDGPALGVRSR
ncbi:PQQ-binding-like beta-propeller repeat protein [Salarchaeum sp. III]|uniref:outer membrane protein assembly factor BamB family protein n=1 Tax=Salarchaeum sp. III TaxID=3107927 RepID=UPI002ED900A3